MSLFQKWRKNFPKARALLRPKSLKWLSSKTRKIQIARSGSWWLTDHTGITRPTASTSLSWSTTRTNSQKTYPMSKSCTSGISASPNQCLRLSRSAVITKRRRKLKRMNSEHAKPKNNWMLKSSRWESSKLKLTRNKSRTQQHSKFILELWIFKCTKTSPISYSQSRYLQFGI